MSGVQGRPELPLGRRLVRNTVAQVGGSGVNTLVGLVITASLTRHLGVVGYGQYALVFVYLYFASVLATLGIDVILLRELALEEREDETATSRLVSSAVLLKLGLALAAIALMAAFLFGLKSYPAPLALAIMVSTTSLLVGAFDSVGVVFRVRLRMEYAVLSSWVAQGIHLLLVLGLVLARAPLLPFVLAYCVAIAARVLCQWQLSRAFVRVRFAYDPATVRRLLRESLPMGLGSGLWIVYHSLDNLLLESMRGIAAVALYSVAYKFVDLAISTSGMVMASLYPLLSQRVAGSRDELARLYQKAFDYVAILGAAFAVAVFVAAPLVVPVLFGPRFAASTVTVQILAPTALFVYCNNLFTHLLIALGLQGAPLLTFRAVGVAVNVALNVLLIPRWGVNGAAAATLASEIVSFAVAQRLAAAHLRELPRPRIFLGVALAAAAAMAATTVVAHPVVGSILGLAIFATLLLACCREKYPEIRGLVAGGSLSHGRP